MSWIVETVCLRKNLSTYGYKDGKLGTGNLNEVVSQFVEIRNTIQQSSLHLVKII